MGKNSHTGVPPGLVLAVAAAVSTLVVVRIWIARTSGLVPRKKVVSMSDSQVTPRLENEAGTPVSERPAVASAAPVSEGAVAVDAAQAPEGKEDSETGITKAAKGILIPVLALGIPLVFVVAFQAIAGLINGPDDLPKMAAGTVALAAGAVLVAVIVDMLTIFWSWLAPPAKALNFFAALLALLGALLVLAVTP